MAAKKTAKPFDPLAAAKQLAPSSILSPNAGFRAVHANARFGVKNLADAEAILSAKLTGWDGAALKDFSATLAAYFTAGQAVEASEPKKNDDLDADIGTLWGLRRVLLTSAEALRNAGVAKDSEVDAIRKGSGPVDAAKDCVDLGRLHKKYADQLKGKSFITSVQVEQAIEVGQRVQKATKPRSAKRLTPAELVKARLQRDQLFTLLSQQHDELWSAAAVAFGKRHLAEFFPDLLAKQVSAPAKPAEEKKAPATTPAVDEATPPPAAE